jgi:hypothetical protein
MKRAKEERREGRGESRMRKGNSRGKETANQVI